MLFFLYGPDTWRRNRKLKQITDKFVRDADPSRMNLRVLDAAGTAEEKLRQELRAAPFLARKRMVVLKNFLIGAKRKALQEILEENIPALGEGRVLVVSENGEKPKPKKWPSKTVEGLWKYLEKYAQCESFPEFSGARLEKEIYVQAKAHGLTLEKDAAVLLAVMSGGDLGWVEKELEKLGAYCSMSTTPPPSLERRGNSGVSPLPEGGLGGVGVPYLTITTLNHIKLLCTAEGEANIFEFLDALGNKDQTTLLRTAEEQLRETDALHLVARATAHLRALLAMKLAGQAGAIALKLHPFQAKKISAQLRNWDPPTIKRFLFQLMTLDYSTKRGLAVDPTTQLTALLVQFSS